jgi:carbonic anhydrase
MDARIDVHRMLDLEEGDAHVIRNAGGVVTEDVIRSLTHSQRLGTDRIMLVMHTDCGAGIPDLDEAVRDGVAQVRTSPSIPNTTEIGGFVYDPDERTLRQVV